MPVDLGTPVREPHPLFYDNRRGAHGFGVNGHVNLTFEGPQVRCSYVDWEGNLLLEEMFTMASGDLELVSQRLVVQDPNFYGPRARRRS
jgi:hypothetical protein